LEYSSVRYVEYIEVSQLSQIRVFVFCKQRAEWVSLRLD